MSIALSVIYVSGDNSHQGLWALIWRRTFTKIADLMIREERHKRLGTCGCVKRRIFP